MKAFQFIRKLLELLTPEERRKGAFVLGLLTLMAVMEALGVASIMPFMTVMGNPEAVQTNPMLKRVYEFFAFSDPERFMLFVGAGVFCLYISVLGLKLLTTYAIFRYSLMRFHSFGSRMLQVYLRQPYTFFLNRNTSDMGKLLLTEVGVVTQGVLMTLLRLLAGVVVIVAVVGLLLTVEGVLTLAVGAGVCGIYAVLYLCTRKMLHRIGEQRLDANEQRFRVANEALASIKELRLLGREHTFLRRFDRASFAFAHYRAIMKVVGVTPFFGIQALVFLGLVFMLLHLSAERGGLQNALPVISMFAFAAYRLLPAFQEVYVNATELRFSLPALDAVHKDMQTKQQTGMVRLTKEREPLPLQEALELDGVSYIYPGAKTPSLRSLSLRIPKGASVAFVGATGSGKSTIVDVILGLLAPTAGELRIDGSPLVPDDLRRWQQAVGYVPQAVFLSDDTVLANIAFGEPEELVDRAAAERAAKAAQIHDFIVEELDQGYETVIGERGVRLSGGQRQRLAIARALYHDPPVLVLDEATSALDNRTEAQVMEAVEAMWGRKTVIMVAHRLSTIKQCDTLFLLDRGALAATGTYAELAENSDLFIALKAEGQLTDARNGANGEGTT